MVRSCNDALVTRKELASIELFRGLSASALDDVRTFARRVIFAKEARIFDQGEGRVRAHALLEGGVRISQSGSDGAQIVLRLIAPGEIFGTIAAFADRRYPGDADAMLRSVEVSWSESDLTKLMNRNPQIALNALRILGRRLHETQDRLREVSTQPVERRVAHTLLRLVHQFGRVTSLGTTIDLPLRRRDVADIAGTTLYSVSRVLTNWENRDWLITREQKLTVLKLNDIRTIAEANAE